MKKHVTGDRGPQRYRKRPVEIEAFALTDVNAAVVTGWINDHAPGTATMRGGPEGGSVGATILIRTLEGNMLAEPGDFIIRGIAGEFYPCKADIFEKTYVPVPTIPSSESP